MQHESSTVVTQDAVTILPGPRFRAAMVLAIIADALQIVVFPLFVEGALSPADDVLDFGIATLLVHLLGWHWEFLPSFLAKLVPGIDLVPFWTTAVASVYRKSKPITVAESRPTEVQGWNRFPICDETRNEPPSKKGSKHKPSPEMC